MTQGESDLSRALGAAREKRRGVRAALDEVESALATAAPGRSREWSRVLAERLGALREAFVHHVQVTEASDGLLQEILADAPRMSHRVKQIRDDHVGIQTAIDRAIEQVQGGEDLDEAGIGAARNSTLQVLQGIVRHRHLGADLVYDAYNVDIEAAD